MSEQFDPFAGAAILSTAPSTEPQREIWTAAQAESAASLSYNESVTLVLRGEVDLTALTRSFSELVARHESLRMTFSSDGLTLCVSASEPVAYPLLDLGLLDAEQAERRVAEFVREHVEAAFDLERGPLYRLQLLRLSASEMRAIFTAHHIVCDGWSAAVLIKEWGQLYSAACAGRASDLPPAESFSSYARELVAQASEASDDAAETYWLKQFAGAVPVLELPYDRARPLLKTYEARRVDVVLDTALVQVVKKTGAKLGASLFTTLLAAFNALLHRLSGQEELVVGIPAAGQAVAGHERLVGHCVNILALRSVLSAELPFAELLAALRSTLLDAYEHQALTFGSLLTKLPIRRDPSRLPLVSVVFNVERGLRSEEMGFAGLDADLLTNPRHYENFDLFVNAVERASGLTLECQYNTSLFDEITIRRWLSAFEQLLHALSTEPSMPIGSLPMLPSGDLELLARWNEQTRAMHASPSCVHQLVEAQVLATPNAVACEFEGTQISYLTLNARANQLARRLRALGVARGTLVGLCIERSPEMLLGLLAILKAGGAYVPLDPDYPADRLAFMIEDSGIAFLVAESKVLPGLSVAVPNTVLLDRDAGALAQEDAANFSAADGVEIGGEDVAYVIYTSGSTGKPKGVLVPHRGVVNLLNSVARSPGLAQSDVVLAVTTLSFDIAVSELILPLTVGARIVLVSREVASDGARLLEVVRGSRVTFIDATPATYRLLLAAGFGADPKLKLICTGEAMPKDLALELVERAASVWNGYGPTETTVWSTFYRVLTPVERILIGRPVDNTQVHILDARMQPTPIGVPGEIFIAGDGVALGYLNRPELSRERFVPNPFASEPGRRIYKTGDLGRYHASGEIECLGRYDNQVKLRGYRIELGEIENALSQHELVAESAVIVREDQPGDARLVAYACLRQGQSASDTELRAHLKRTLPDYMVPASYVRLTTMPLTPSGKIDRKALPAPDAAASTAGDDFVAPSSANERLLAALWEEALRVPRLSIHDDFFMLGGHSLLASQILARLRRDHGIELSFRKIFEAPTIAELALLLDSGESRRATGSAAAIPRRSQPGPAPLTVAQERLWMLQEMDPSYELVHNLPAAWQLDGVVDVALLQRALDEIAQRHETLRTTLQVAGGKAVQVVAPSVSLPIRVIDLSARPESVRHEEMMETIAQLTRERFDLFAGPLFRSCLFVLGPSRSVYYTVRHNFVWDGWSFDIFLRELTTLYAAFESGAGSPLAALPISYADYVSWHHEFLAGPEIAAQTAWWREQLAFDPPELALPTDRPRPSKSKHIGGNATTHLSRAEADALTNLGRASGATLYMVLLAAYKLMLHRYSGQHDILIGTPVRARNRPEVEELIGPFINAVIIRTKFDATMTFKQLLSRVRDATLDAFSHQDMPLERLGARPPIVRAFFSLQDARTRPPALGNIQIQQLHVDPAAASTDMTLWMMETRRELLAVVNYSTELFDSQTIERFLGGFSRLLRALVDNPDAKLAELPIAREEEVMQVERWSNPQGVLVSDLAACVRQQATHRPDAPALSDGQTALSYTQLWQRVERTSALLSARSIGPSKLVAIYSDSAIEVVLGILSALRVGAAFTLLDPRLPAARNARIAQRLTPDLLLLSDDAQLPEGVLGATLRFADALDVEAVAGSAPREASPAWLVARFDDAGLLRTCAVSYAALASSLRATASELGLTADDTVVGLSPTTSELALFEMFVPLCVGARLLLPGAPARLDRLGLTAKSATLFAPATAWQRLNSTELALFRSAVVLGEPRAALVEAMLASGIAAFRLHAFLEAGFAPFLHRLHDVNASRRIGRPLYPARVTLRGPGQGSCAINAVGSLHVGTALEAQPAPSERKPSEGRQQARFHSDGSLELLVSNDGRAEVLGHSFHLSEVSSVLDRHVSIARSAVTVARSRLGAECLTAYVVVRAGAHYTETELRRFLRNELPDFMVPQAFFEVDAIPVKDDGSLDVSLLPSPYRNDPGEEYLAPRSAAEQLLAQLWSEALALPRVSLYDNFFDLGGHSFLCFKVLASIEQRTGKRISPRSMLLGSLEQVAAELPELAPRAADSSAVSPAPSRPVAEPKRPSVGGFLQKLKGIVQGS